MALVLTAYIVSICALLCCGCHRKVPVNYVLLFVFTLSLSCLIGVVCMQTDPGIVVAAAGLTFAMVLGLTGYACTTKQDFTASICGFFILPVLLLVVIASIPFMFIPGFIRTMHLIYCVIGVLIFSFYIIWDTQMIMGGQHAHYQFTEDDYILAAVILYIDIIQLFLYILRILSNR